MEESDRSDFAQRLQKQLLALENLASQMLQFIKPGLQASQICRVDDLVRESAEQVQGLFQRHQICLKLNLSAPDASLEAEPTHLVAALVAILENAAQSSHAGQEVTLSTLIEGGRAEITIADQGRGIQSDMLNSLFEPFSTSRASGTGLGLSIASNTIRRHRGEVTANNSVQGGAIFTVVLPVLMHL